MRLRPPKKEGSGDAEIITVAAITAAYRARGRLGRISGFEYQSAVKLRAKADNDEKLPRRHRGSSISCPEVPFGEAVDHSSI
jgi:hypothetical protein